MIVQCSQRPDRRRTDRWRRRPARHHPGEFIARYNTEWLIGRLGQQTPVAARAAAMAA
jgi:hypothetical protein